MGQNLISAEDFLSRAPAVLLDVRAEVEFASGHIPGSLNLPLLRDAERHQVGIAYKNKGQSEAVKLGHELVDPHRPERVEAWRRFLSAQCFPALTCFRGGLRSEIAQRWLREAGCEAARVEGGYKALRRALLREWERTVTGYVLTGFTGSGKSAFLRSYSSAQTIDLEALAAHRGSAFGGIVAEQPAQQTFENALAWELRRKTRPLLFEDESRLVGRCVIPETFYAQWKVLPRVFLDSTERERVENIFGEYVAEPLRKRGASQVMGSLLQSLRTLRNRLGVQATREMEEEIERAFASGEDELHRAWIARLLKTYYDPLYEYSLRRSECVPVFRGNARECREWLKGRGF